MRAEDLPFVYGLEQLSFGTPWSRNLLLEMLESRLDRVWILEDAEGPAGYLDYRCAAGEGELMRMAVLPEKRGRGYGAMLVRRMLAAARGEDAHDPGMPAPEAAERILLEVRASNTAAVRLYETAGFRQISRRKAYYENPAEDALIYQIVL